MKLEGTLRDAAAFASTVGAKFGDAFRKDGDFAAIRSSTAFANVVG